MVLLLSKNVKQYLLKNPLKGRGQEVNKESPDYHTCGLSRDAPANCNELPGVGEKGEFLNLNQQIQIRKQALTLEHPDILITLVSTLLFH